MVAQYLRRGLAAGLLAGLLAGLFAFFVGEPLLDSIFARLPPDQEWTPLP